MRDRVRTTYGYFAGGLGVTAVAAMAASRATGLLRLMSTRPLLVRGGVAGAWVRLGVLCMSGCSVGVEWKSLLGFVEVSVGVRSQCWGEKTVLGVKRQCWG